MLFTPVSKWVKVTQSCPTLCDPMDCTVHGILQARMLEQVAVPFYRGSSQPREQIQVSCTAGGFFTIWATRETRVEEKGLMNYVSVGLEAPFWAKRYVLKMTNDMNTKKYYQNGFYNSLHIGYHCDPFPIICTFPLKIIF